MSYSHVEPQPPGISEIATRMREDFGMLRGALERQRAEVEDQIRAFVTTRPLVSLGAAFGVGYVLGGGLFSRLTTHLAGLGIRILASDLVASTLTDMDRGGVSVPPPKEEV